MAMSQKKLALKRAKKNQARKGKKYNPKRYYTVKDNVVAEVGNNTVMVEDSAHTVAQQYAASHSAPILETIKL
jgi:hypothetical protein